MYAGINAGGTTIMLAAFSSLDATEPVAGSAFALLTANNFQTDVNSMQGGLRSLADRFGPISGVGAVVAGRLSPDRSRLLRAGNLTEWCHTPKQPRSLHTQISMAVSSLTEVVLGNDAEGQALHEARYNRTLAGRDFLYVTCGTGIGVARVTWIAGVPYSLPTEAGHMVPAMEALWDNPRRCGCGQLNCIERRSGGSGIEQRFGKPAADLTGPEWEDVATELARGISYMLLNHLVDAVVIGGGVVDHQPQLPERVGVHLEAREIAGIGAEVVPAMFGKDAGPLGGLALLRSRVRAGAGI